MPTNDHSPVPRRGGDVLGLPAEKLRDQTVTARAEAARKKLALQEQQAAARAEFEAKRSELEQQMRAQMHALEQQLEPLQAELRKLQEVVWTVDLYLGRDEDLTLLRDGATAPADTPIVIRQKVLVMAEESLVLGLDAHARGAEGIDGFVDWMLQSPENLDRVLPEPKGVVVLIPTRVPVQSGNQFEDAVRNAANQQAHWLIRNGERLYLLSTDPELRVRDRIVPLRDEFQSVFEERLFGTVQRVEPGSERWLQLEAQADAKRRHYMRLMLVLQGLVDRTPAWHPLPPGGVNLMSVQSQHDGLVRIVQDGDRSIQLGDGHETFAQWQKRLNSQLRPGLRIVGDWNSEGFRDLDWGEYRWQFPRRHPRIHPSTVESIPASTVPHLIEGRRDGMLVIRYARTETVYRRNVPVPDKTGYVYRGEYPTAAKQRASCLVDPTDEWVIPFDLATTADLRYFLNSREERGKHFLSMVPVLRSALAAKEQEAAAEAPFRRLLTDRLLEAGAAPDAVADELDELVTWWKCKNVWSRPLNGDPKHEGKALADIVKEHTRRRKLAHVDTSKLLAAAQQALPNLMCLAVTPGGQWRGYAPASAPDIPTQEQVWVDMVELRADATVKTVERWKTIPHRTFTSLQVTWQTDTWSSWNHVADLKKYLTGPERQALVDELTAMAPGPALAVVEAFDEQRGLRELGAYYWSDEQPPADRPVVAEHQVLGDRRHSPVTAIRMKVEKDAAGARLVDGSWGGLRDYFGGFTGGSVRDQRPWASKGSPWLVWSDEQLLAQATEYQQRCAAAAEDAKERRCEFQREVGRWVASVVDAVDAVQLRQIRARFDEDFGADADDLWEAHLKSLKRGQAIPGRELRELLEAALASSRPVAGATLADLYSWSNKTAPDEYQGVVIQPPPSDQE